MTPRERAEAIPATRFTLRDAWIDAIEQAIIAAEDAAFKAGAKEEREACAKIAEKMHGQFWHKQMREAATSIMEQIRARGTK